MLIMSTPPIFDPDSGSPSVKTCQARLSSLKAQLVWLRLLGATTAAGS